MIVNRGSNSSHLWMMQSYFLISKPKKLKKSFSNGRLMAQISHINYDRGLTDHNLMIAKYRFNQSFHLIGADNFLKDLFNDKNVTNGFFPLN